VAARHHNLARIFVFYNLRMFSIIISYNAHHAWLVMGKRKHQDEDSDEGVVVKKEKTDIVADEETPRLVFIG